MAPVNNRFFRLLIVFSLCSYTSFSQRHYYQSYNSLDKGQKKLAQRSYFGISLPSMNLNLLQTYQIDRKSIPNSGPSVDTTILINKRSLSKLGFKGAFGIYGGTCFKLAKTGETSMIALDVATSVELYNWRIGTVKYSKIDSAIDNAFCYVGRIPLSVMYKSGGEADLTSKNKVLFSIGAGLAPTFAAAIYNSNDGGFFKITPFLVSELGIWFGTAVKIRFSYFPGTFSLINSTGNDLPGYTTNGNLTVSGTGSGNYMFTFLLLFNAHMWEHDRY
jgi:hypothetical protein